HSGRGAGGVDHRRFVHASGDAGAGPAPGAGRSSGRCAGAGRRPAPGMACDHGRNAMNALARTFPFTLLTLAAVFSFIAAAWLSVDAGWPVRLGLAALTLALWGIWFGVYRIRLRGEGEPGEQISPPDAARNRFMVLHVVFALTFVVA